MTTEGTQPLLLRRARPAAPDERHRTEPDRTELRSAVGERLAALDEVLAAGAGRLPEERLAPARGLADRAGERLRTAGGHTVVALAGATGSGKSSLFNALAGAPVSAVGVRRPTTGVAHAVIWGAEGAGALLDWLQVPRRHYLDFLTRPDDGDHRLDGLVLLDLPDHDSTTLAHRLAVDRLVEQVDLLVWVLDPQKYADAAVHERYLRPLAGHAAVLAVVLNQADRLPAHQVDLALADVCRLVAADGLGGVPVLATSAVTAGGLDALRRVLVDVVATHLATLRRLAAELDEVSIGLAGTVAGPAPEPSAEATGELSTALAAAAGVPAVAAATRQAYLHRAIRATGFPFLRRPRPDPLDRLRPEPTNQAARSAEPAGPANSSGADPALRTLADRVSASLPDPWPAGLRRAARSHAAELPDRLDRAVAGVELGLDDPPAWWRALAVVQALLGAAALAGGLWLAGNQLLGLPAPAFAGLRLPAVLLLGGLLLGLAVALPARLLATRLAGRCAARAEARLRAAVAEVADDLVVTPVRAELAAYAALRAALARLQPH